MKKLLIIVLSAGLLLFGSACEVEDTTDGQADNKPRQVTEGAKFTIGKYTVRKGWKVARDALGGFAVKNVQVKNTSKDSDTVLFTVKILKGNTVWASVDCTTDEIEPGQVQRANCIGLGEEKFKRGWTSITAESMF